MVSGSRWAVGENFRKREEKNEDQKLNKELVDPRYNWVHKAKYAETIYDLSKNWATDPNYGEKIDSIITEIEKFVNSSM